MVRTNDKVMVPEADRLLGVQLWLNFPMNEKFSKPYYHAIRSDGDLAQVLFISAKALNEPIAWAGPIVMNTQKELEEAFDDLDKGNFIRENLKFED